MFEALKYLDSVKRIHFIGIGGSGMCPLAEILNKQGYILTGSDNNETDTLNRVKSLGIPVFMGQRAENIKGAEMVVYSSAIQDDNPELKAARESSVPTFERSKLLGALSKKYKRSIGISGTHGKTTATSMLAEILIKSGTDPTAVVGGRLPLTGTNGVLGGSDLFLVEACEFKNTFLELFTTCAVILNIDADHLDFFKTMENLKSSFKKFSENSETVIYNGDDENVKDAIKDVKDKNFITFGLKGSNDWRAENITLKENSRYGFDLIHNNKNLGEAELSIPGKHNVYNALAAIAAADYAGVPAGDSLKIIKDFKGAGRRFQFLGVYKGAAIYDDYAHHPTELKATLTAAKGMNYNKIIAIFQPFTYSRTAMFLNEFSDALKIADNVILTPIMGSREKNDYNIRSQDLAKKIPSCKCVDTFEEAALEAVNSASEGDMIITLGCGDIYKVAKIIIDKLK